MKYLIALAIAATACVTAFVCLKREWFYKMPLLSGGTELDNINTLEDKWIYICGVLMGAAAFAATLKVFAESSDVINRARMLLILVCLTGSACTDLREHRIPNLFPAVLAVAGLLFLAVGAAAGQEGAKAYIISCIFAAIVTTLALLVIRAITKEGIGMGDVKLLVGLAITGGVFTIFGTFFFSIIACVLCTVALLITKKKTMKESLPFGPFIYLGFIITIFAYKF